MARSDIRERWCGFLGCSRISLALNAGYKRYSNSARLASIAPDLTRHLDNASELGAPHLLADADVLGRAGREAALRAERELLELDIAARLLDATLDEVGSLELGDLGGDQAKHHELAGRHRAQRLEGACACVVILQKVDADLH